MSITFLEHTADILFQAEGKNFQDALEEAAKALSITISEKVQKKEDFEIHESAVNLEELVVAVLSSLLSESEVREMIPGGLKITSFKEGQDKVQIKAKAWAGEGTQKTIVKGVTYGMLKVERKKDKCVIQVLLDI